MASVTVTTEDLQKRWDEGKISDQFGKDYLETQIADAIDDADGRWSTQIESRLASGVLRPGRYKRVICDAVFRVIRNPDGYTSENNGSYGYGRNQQVASGSLFFTAADVAILAGEVSSGIPGTIGVGLDRGWR